MAANNLTVKFLNGSAGYQEYVMTVASQKLQGIVGVGVNVLSDVYAVKKDMSQEWEQFTGIQDFNYESGYEYVIKISETNYLRNCFIATNHTWNN